MDGPINCHVLGKSPGWTLQVSRFTNLAQIDKWSQLKWRQIISAKKPSHSMTEMFLCLRGNDYHHITTSKQATVRDCEPLLLPQTAFSALKKPTPISFYVFWFGPVYFDVNIKSDTGRSFSDCWWRNRGDIIGSTAYLCLEVEWVRP